MTPQPSAVLDDLVACGHESGGAVAVVRGGVLEIDHTGGTRNGATPWSSDTLLMTFSVAKPFAALAFLDAVANGHIALELLDTEGCQIRSGVSGRSRVRASASRGDDRATKVKVVDAVKDVLPDSRADHMKWVPQL